MTVLQAGALVGGRYELRRELARGGMGSVWEALHLQLEAPVAVKFMDPALCANDVARERFTREAKAAAQIRSPHVVHITDYGLEGDLPFIVMEMLSGEDLDERLSRGSLSLDEAERVVVQAAKGLRKVHEAGTVHRDMKPSNLFLAGDGHEWVVKLIDFGVARAAAGTPLGAATIAPNDGPRPPATSSPELTHAGTVLGSPQYMSPEQARGFKEVDHQADVWALAAIAFRAVTGRRLFDEGLDAMQVLTKLCYEPLPIPSQLAPELPLPLQRFFDRALHQEQAYRFPDAMSLAHGFSAACGEVRQLQDLASIPGTAVPAPAPSGSVSLESSGMVPRMPLASLPGHGSLSGSLPMPVTPAPARPTWLPLVAIGVAVLAIGSMSVVGVLASANAGGPAARARDEVTRAVTRVGDRVASIALNQEDEEAAEAAEAPPAATAAPEPEPEVEPEPAPRAAPEPTPTQKGNRWGF